MRWLGFQRALQLREPRYGAKNWNNVQRQVIKELDRFPEDDFPTEEAFANKMNETLLKDASAWAGRWANASYKIFGIRGNPDLNQALADFLNEYNSREYPDGFDGSQDSPKAYALYLRNNGFGKRKRGQ